MSPLELQILSATPRHLSDVSAWIQHIPFAFALVEMLRPRRIVELGTHKGDSYCAFCQAVDMLHLDTSCAAIDTWLGDSQSGIYDESVLEELRAHHDPLYSHFSKLIRAGFDEAVDRFEDGSIDLLHLDGLHHYDAVRHDFDTWRPKLSDSAVVLLHDTHIRRGDFGVFRLWEELRLRFPHVEFEHGCGLGVLAVGENVPPAFQRFLTLAHRSPVSVTQLFRTLGQRLELSRGVAQLGNDVVDLELQANAWRSSAQQPTRAILPEDLVFNGPLDLEQHDIKALLDRLHEASLNHRDDMATIAMDNRNLRRVFNQLRVQYAGASTRPVEAAPADVAADIGAVVATMNRAVEDRNRCEAQLAVLQKTVGDLVEELRSQRMQSTMSKRLRRMLATPLRMLRKCPPMNLWRTRTVVARRDGLNG